MTRQWRGMNDIAPFEATLKDGLLRCSSTLFIDPFSQVRNHRRARHDTGDSDGEDASNT